MKKNAIINHRINAVREELKKQNISAYVIPDKDPHLSETPPSHWKIREWISGFTGSQGTVVITQDEAFLWTDSRYFIQAQKELNGTEYQLCKEGLPDTQSPLELLCGKLSKNERVGIDGQLFSIATTTLWEKVLLEKEILLSTSLSLPHGIWPNRPSIPTNPIFEYPIKYNGNSAEHKIKKLQKHLYEKNIEALIVTSLDEIAWTLNLRGNDVEYTPVFISYLLITNKKVILFINPEKINNSISEYLNKIKVEVIPYDNTFDFLNKTNLFSSILLDHHTVNYALYQSLPNNTTILFEESPIALLKAIKNPIEQKEIKEAMLKDGVALVQFLKWLDENKNTKQETELSIEQKLLSFRQKQDLFISESFSTIAGYKENAAIVHYSATKESNTSLQPKGFILIDSGAQYLNGTTDITRTISLGELTDEEKKDYTLVLKGHITLASAVFPLGTRGTQLDILARLPLWKNKLNFLHGTGHGVGHFLSVHEGPQSIRMNENSTLLKPGMVISNEPGIYKEGNHGIRTENLLLVTPAGKGMFGEYLQFETLTLCPICTKGIIKEMLSEEEIEWLNNYHNKVYQSISPLLAKEEKQWLKQATQAI